MKSAWCWNAGLVGLLLLPSCDSLMGRLDEDRNKPFGIRIETRDHWPEGVPLLVRIDYDGPRYRDKDLEATVQPRYPGGGIARDWFHAMNAFVHPAPGWVFRRQEVGVPPVGTDGIDFDLTVKKDGDFFKPVIWNGKSHIPIKVGGTIDDILSPVKSPALDNLITGDGEMVVICRDGIDNANHQWFVEIPRPVLGNREDVPTCTLAVQVDVQRNGRTVATSSGWWRYRWFADLRSAVVVEDETDNYQMLSLSGDLAALDAIRQATGRWTLHITPRPDLALRDFNSDTYWGGDITIPLVVQEIIRDPREGRWPRHTLYDGRVEQKE